MLKMADEHQNTKSKKAMTWTNEHNEILVREMYLFQPWNFKKGSQQRGNAWEISDSLNDMDSPRFNVTQKSVRDHYTLLQKQQKKRLREEEKASGISPEPSAVETSIEEIIQLFRNRDEEEKILEEKQKQNSVAEVEKAVEIRQQSMETLAETYKRKSQSKDGEKPKRRMSSNGSEIIAYLQQKSRVYAELKREELMLKKAEADERKQQQNNIISQQEALTKALTDSIAAQQRQQEQLMHQLQFQNTALLTLMQNIVKKD
ncbi:trichohyalin-like [Xenia sp. Carnegie-2017]|uniref:trichohyalin-like n=1 Tax=Xenia sp. Carnegie-2017 TaxID=2897299 RepID=UPI001F04276A|nr:trichohyalin-like [Xenia sp. Carnegie-2017]